MSEKATRDQWDVNKRPLAKDGGTHQKLDFTNFTWPERIKAINPKLVDTAPPPC